MGVRGRLLLAFLAISMFALIAAGSGFFSLSQVGSALRIITEQRIRELENEKKLMRARSVLIGQENERKRIAHDLHDGIGVLLSTASQKFSQIKVNPKDTETAELFEKATKLLTETFITNS